MADVWGSDLHARFETDYACTCARSYHFTREIVFKEVPMLCPLLTAFLRVVCFIIGVLTLGATRLCVPSPYHRCIEIHYECSRCRHRFCKTYELRGKRHGGMKQNRFGWYRCWIAVQRSFSHRIRLRIVEVSFSELRDGYNVVHWNCIHFANALLEELRSMERRKKKNRRNRVEYRPHWSRHRVDFIYGSHSFRRTYHPRIRVRG